jgi:hypothetical protein
MEYINNQIKQHGSYVGDSPCQWCPHGKFKVAYTLAKTDTTNLENFEKRFVWHDNEIRVTKSGNPPSPEQTKIAAKTLKTIMDEF